jgi:DNA-binding transcriptional LysR family regulator
MQNPDLNLLRIFDLLFEERSVSRAARRLNLTQSAVSHALARLREMMGDPLFTRGAGGLHPTARAEELAPQLREILVRVRTALSPPSFDPRSSSREFTIAAGAYFCRLLIPPLVVLARGAAPGVTLRIVNVDQALLDELDQGTVDIGIGAFEQIPARIKSLLLFNDLPVWVASQKHPLAGTHPDMATLEAQPSLSIVADYPYRPLRSDGAGERMRRRAIVGSGQTSDGASPPSSAQMGMRVYDSDTATAVVARTDLIAMLPRRLAAARAEEEGLYLFDTPTDAPAIELTMLWHSRFNEDPGLAWLRGLIVEVSNLES